ncbi:MAG: ROK family protein [Candidatus Margulisbacteria bacterium]|nr:ROK family protein [Candidatus Margulisiibacteriota bacterium]
MKYIIGLDIGGTKIAAAIADDKGKIITSINTPTQAKKGAEVVTNQLSSVIKELLKNAGVHIQDVKTIVLGIPGQITKSKGVVIIAPNIKGWENYPLRDKVQKDFPNTPIIVENDANCAAMGELYFGSEKDYKNIVFLTVSTGVGGGIIIDRKLYSGKNTMAGEIGHMPLNLTTDTEFKCGCGRIGCFEAYASGVNMAKRASKKIMKLKTTKDDYGKITLELSASNRSKITSIVLNHAAKQGDKFAQDIIEENAYYIGIGCVNIINILDPEAIIIGGGVSKIGDILFKAIRKTVQEHLSMVKNVKTEIIPATLGTDAGLLGTIAVGLSE